MDERGFPEQERRDRGRTPQGESSSERILDAAIELISERGYSATSVDALCKRAGLVKTAVYWHFGSKEGLLAAVVERVATTWIEEVQKSAYQVGVPLQRLALTLRGLRAIVEERPRLLRLVLSVLFERAGDDQETRRALNRIFIRGRRAIVEGIEASLPGIRDPDAIAHTILSLMQGALVLRLADPVETDLDRLFGDMQRTVILVLADRLRELGHTPGPGSVSGSGSGA